MYANWSSITQKKDKSLNDVNNLIDIVTSLRSFKNELGISPGSYIDISVNKCSKKIVKFFNNNDDVIKKIGRIKSIKKEDLNKPSASLIIKGELYKLYFDQDVDLIKIKETLSIRLNKFKGEMEKLNSRLSNKNFTNKAPKNIVEQEKTNFYNLKKDVKKIELTLKGL